MPKTPEEFRRMAENFDPFTMRKPRRKVMSVD
jgi:hypothetical protein